MMRRNGWLWILLTLFLAGVILAWLGLLWGAYLLPHEVAFVLGFFGFLVLGFSLLRDYAWVAGMLEDVLRTRTSEAEASQRIRQAMSGAPRPELTFMLLLRTLLQGVAPIRYAFYGFVVLLLLVAVALQITPGAQALALVMTGLFLGGMVAVFFVWVLDMSVTYLLGEYAQQLVQSQPTEPTGAELPEASG